ncbi:MAG: nucleoside-diphosphate sugar epimerase [Phycisphaerae bacterium]|nr:nucleoside-diphosphate sugar epimerase [Phycisphaerae bacterium]
MPTGGGQAGERRRVLVTGGAGFVGSHLVERLLADGCAVTVLDDLSTGRRENLDHVDPGGAVRFIEGDARDTLERLVDEDPIDEVYHLAAAVGVELVLRDPIGAMESNVDLTALVLRFASGRPLEGRGASSPARADRVLITSSSEVYGKSSRESFSEDDDVVYGSTSVTRWSYAYAKAIDEFLALAFMRSEGLPVVCARLFNTVGPRQVGAYGMVLPRFVEAALRGEPITVYGDGSQSRCFCDVRDVCGALVGLMRGLPETGGVFNVGGDEPITIGALAELVRDELGSSSEIRAIPYEEAYPEGFEDLPKRRPDLARIRSAVGYEPKIPLRDTVRDIAAWVERGGRSSGRRSGAGA